MWGGRRSSANLLYKVAVLQHDIDVRTSSERRATNGSPASRESAMDSSAHYFREHQ